MALAYTFRCECGARWEGPNADGFCPDCGAIQTWSGMIQRDYAPVEKFATSNLLIGEEIASPPAHDAWFKSDATQEAIRKGEYQTHGKGSDAWNRRMTRLYK